MKYINLLEKYLGKRAKTKKLPLQKGDILETFSSTKNLKETLVTLHQQKLRMVLKNL